MEYKLTINDGPKAYKHVVKEPEAAVFLGLKIGDKVKGDNINLPGYEFKITGGSDNAGFPMKKGISGSERGKMLIKDKKGAPRRKTVVGNTISELIAQVNMIVSKKGSKELSEYIKPVEEKK